MRRFLSIFLLVLLGLPAAAPLFALGQTPESRLPACCRRTGDHHCAGNMAAQMDMSADQADSHVAPNPRFAPITPRCPYTPSILPTQHLNPGVAASLVRLDARLQTQDFISPEVFTTRCTSDDPSRPKRGPPASSHS